MITTIIPSYIISHPSCVRRRLYTQQTLRYLACVSLCSYGLNENTWSIPNVVREGCDSRGEIQRTTTPIFYIFDICVANNRLHNSLIRACYIRIFLCRLLHQCSGQAPVDGPLMPFAFLVTVHLAV